jgi:Domain of unknown function (DUF4124)
MSKIHFESYGRSMRWYEWLSLLFLFGAVCGVRAESVYKCTGAQGAITYQAQPCAPTDTESNITIAPAPTHVHAPEYAVSKGAAETVRTPREHGRSLVRRSEESPQQTSYECRVSDGEIFYRHTPCPHSANGNTRTGKGRDSRSSQGLTVSSRKISREEACTQIRRPGAIGRSGREHDEDVSTYDRNLGHDPCR